MEAAVAELTSLGFREDDIRYTIYEILQAFDDDEVMGWKFARENNYQLVINMLEYKRMKEKNGQTEAKKNDARDQVVEFDHSSTSIDHSSTSMTPTKCFGMSSDEED